MLRIFNSLARQKQGMRLFGEAARVDPKADDAPAQRDELRHRGNAELDAAKELLGHLLERGELSSKFIFRIHADRSYVQVCAREFMKQQLGVTLYVLQKQDPDRLHHTVRGPFLEFSRISFEQRENCQNGPAS